MLPFGISPKVINPKVINPLYRMLYQSFVTTQMEYPEIGVPPNHPVNLPFPLINNHPFEGDPIYGIPHMYVVVIVGCCWVIWRCYQTIHLSKFSLEHFNPTLSHSDIGACCPFSVVLSLLPVGARVAAKRDNVVSRQALDQYRRYVNFNVRTRVEKQSRTFSGFEKVPHSTL